MRGGEERDLVSCMTDEMIEPGDGMETEGKGPLRMPLCPTTGEVGASPNQSRGGTANMISLMTPGSASSTGRANRPRYISLPYHGIQDDIVRSIGRPTHGVMEQVPGIMHLRSPREFEEHVEGRFWITFRRNPSMMVPPRTNT